MKQNRGTKVVFKPKKLLSSKIENKIGSQMRSKLHNLDY